MTELTWTCHICEESCPDACISVLSVDTSEDFGLPRGTMQQNIRYCNDRPACTAAVATYRHVGAFTIEEEDGDDTER